MGLLNILGLGNNLRKSEYYKRRMATVPREPLKKAVKRYLNSIAAYESMKDYYSDVARGRVSEYGVEEAQAMLTAANSDRWFEERRLRNYYKIDDPTLLLPDRTKPLKYSLVATAGAIVLGILVAAGLYIKGRVLTEKNYREAVNELAPAVDRALREDNLEEARKIYKSLVDKREEWLPKRDYPDVWNKTEENERYLSGLERFLNARNKFGEAKKSAAETKFAEALALVEDIGGVNALLSGIKESDLPEYKRDNFKELLREVNEFNSRCRQYRTGFILYNPIKNDLEKLREEVATLDAKVKKGELFDLDKAAHVVDDVRNYLVILRNIKPGAVGKEDLERVVSDLRAIENSIEGKEGLLTAYELIEHNRVKENARKINESLTSLANTQYVEDGSDEEIKRIRSLLNVAKSDLRQVDSNRVDTFELVSDISGLESRLNESAAKLNAVNRLKESLKSANEDEKISAAVEFVNKYFERDFRAKKWDRVSKAVSIIPEHKRDSVEDIVAVVDLESQLLRDDGRIFARENGFNSGDFAGYDILTSDYAEKKDDKTARNAVENLLKEADLKEGKDVIRLLDELGGLRKEKEDKERLGKIGTNAEMEAKRVARLEALPGEIEATEISVKIALEKLRDAAKTYLESGDKIPDLRLMTNLANSYTKLGKREVAEEINVKIEELKKKYRIE